MLGSVKHCYPRVLTETLQRCDERGFVIEELREGQDKGPLCLGTEINCPDSTEK